MAHSVEFQSIAGTIGGYINDMELVVSTPDYAFLKKKLTLKNGKIEWKVKFLRKKLEYWRSVSGVSRDGSVFSPDQDPGAIVGRRNSRRDEAEDKIAGIQAELEDLVPQLTEELFTEVGDTLVIPPGLWYLCDTIRTNAHLNEDLQPYYLECLRDYQRESLDELYKYKRAMVELATGCHAKGQKILMFDGTTKNSEDIEIGDILMGPDSTPRIVNGLHRGRQKMVKIIPTKGESFKVNIDHILSLQQTNRTKHYRTDPDKQKSKQFKGLNRITNISVSDYLSKSKTFKHINKLYRVGVDFKAQERELPIPPYILGLWLGDGHSSCAALTTMDNEIEKEWTEYGASIGLSVIKNTKKDNKASTYFLRDTTSRIGVPRDRMVNRFNSLLRSINLTDNKHIPHIYKTSSRENRLLILAGIIDTDGSLNEDKTCIDYVSISQTLAEDVVFLARSVGLAAYILQCKKSCQTGAIGTYFRVCIQGDTYTIPCKLPRKQAHKRSQVKSVLRTGFSVEEINEDDFYGFSVDGDNLYLMGDFTVTHNCGKSKVIQSVALAAVKSGKRCMIVVPTEYLVGQMAEEMKGLHANTTAQGGGRLAVGGWDVLVTTIQSAAGFADMPDVVCFDETHHIAAESWTKLAMSLSKATHVYGFTATAFRSDGLDVAIHSFAGPIVYSRDVRWGIQNGWLSDFSAFIITVNPKKNGRKIFLSDKNVQATTAYKVLVSSLELFAVARDRLLAGIAKDRKIIVVFKTVKACMDFRKFCAPVTNMDVASAQQGKKSKAPLRRFQNGDAQVLLVNSGLISEGVDIPKADMILQCCQNSSDVMTLQILGRILRKSPDKKKAVIIDIQTNGYEQYVRAGNRRRNVYAKIIGEDNVKTIVVE